MLTTKTPIVMKTWRPLTVSPEDNLVLCSSEILNHPLSCSASEFVLIDSSSDLYHPDVHMKYTHSAHLQMTRTGQPNYFIITKHIDRLLLISKKLRWSANIRIGIQLDSPDDFPKVKDLASLGRDNSFIYSAPFLQWYPDPELDGIKDVFFYGDFILD